MNDLKALISTFNTDQQNDFLLYLKKKNKRKDVKNLQLFQLLNKGDKNQEAIRNILYGEKNRDAYYALRKRLYQSLIEYVANSKLEEENTIDMQSIQYIVAARSFLIQNQIDIGYKILDKAESLAKKHYLFSLLNEIYHTQIQYAHTNPQLNFDQLLADYERNLKNHQQEELLNIVYAKVRIALKKLQFNSGSMDFNKYLNGILATYNIDIGENLSFKSLYQLIQLESISAFAKKDYLQSETFLLMSYEAVKAQPKRNYQTYYHINIVYLIANVLFRNKKFDESQVYLEKMVALMDENKSKHQRAFKLKYLLLRSLNLNYSGYNSEAISLIESENLENHKDLEAILDLKLSLIVYYFQVEDFQGAFSILSKLNHTDSWYIKKVGIDWLLKKNLVEILLHVELQNIDLVESRIKSFKRSHFKYLKKMGQQRAITFMGFVETYIKNPETIKTEKFKELVQNSFVWVEAKREDIFVMSFYAWLKSKMESMPIYKSTLGLIAKAKNVK